jgi:hypothetical protein
MKRLILVTLISALPAWAATGKAQPAGRSSLSLKMEEPGGSVREIRKQMDALDAEMVQLERDSRQSKDQASAYRANRTVNPVFASALEAQAVAYEMMRTQKAEERKTLEAQLQEQ